jgi:membrane protein implicated in regulation of membrane protease activity
VFLALGVILLLVLPDPWNLVVAAVCAVLFVGEVMFWQQRVRRQRVTVGVHTLVGETAEVVAPCRPYGQVRIAGETWAARCEAGADPGTLVRVTAVDGLTLVVEPDPAATR